MIQYDLVVNAKDAHNVVTFCQIFLTIITAVIEAQCDLKYKRIQGRNARDF